MRIKVFSEGYKLNISEKEFSQQVVQVAGLLGWKVFRAWTSIHSPQGFPDLCMVKSSRIIFSELKSEKSKVTEPQQDWLDKLEATGKVEVYLWKPSDFEEIILTLQGERQ